MRLKALREDKDYTQSYIAKIIHVRQNTYSQYENGQREIPIRALMELARFYNTSIDYILEETNNPNRYK